MTKNEENWLLGFKSYFDGVERPSAVGPKQKGWDAAKSCATGGGYV